MIRWWFLQRKIRISTNDYNHHTLPQWSYQYSINRQTLSELAFQRRMLCLLIADGLRIGIIQVLHIFKSNHIDLILCYTLYFKRDESRAFILRRQQGYSCFDKSIAYSYQTESFHYLDLCWKSSLGDYDVRSNIVRKSIHLSSCVHSTYNNNKCRIPGRKKDNVLYLKTNAFCLNDDIVWIFRKCPVQMNYKWVTLKIARACL